RARDCRRCARRARTASAVRSPARNRARGGRGLGGRRTLLWLLPGAARSPPRPDHLAPARVSGVSAQPTSGPDSSLRATEGTKGLAEVAAVIAIAAGHSRFGQFIKGWQFIVPAF